MIDIGNLKVRVATFLVKMVPIKGNSAGSVFLLLSLTVSPPGEDICL
jgi:hypothetical protein